VVVDDAWQRHGLGIALFDRLLCVATHAGITHAFADILADNHAMRRLASKFGCRIRTNPIAPFLVQVTKTLADKDYGREPGFAPCLGTPNPQRMPPVMWAARQQG
jgi:GNAT superfamily N-acetyltransferase